MPGARDLARLQRNNLYRRGPDEVKALADVFGVRQDTGNTSRPRPATKQKQVGLTVNSLDPQVSCSERRYTDTQPAQSREGNDDQIQACVAKLESRLCLLESRLVQLEIRLKTVSGLAVTTRWKSS